MRCYVLSVCMDVKVGHWIRIQENGLTLSRYMCIAVPEESMGAENNQQRSPKKNEETD